MKTDQRDLSYFKLRLEELLRASFPELAWNTTFINQRAQRAASAYEGAFGSGNSYMQCDEIANYILFEGLHFSRFGSVFKVVCNEFDTIMADEELYPFAMQMLPVCDPVFMRYELTDDFEGKTECDLLYTELTGTIQLWIEENGL
ncbi:DUF1896 family protein [Flavobacterium sp. D11R37]|jgi:hypothetical protein|uniref:DUF1896 domain-containing protein n=1 Tax=Flavobacterium TaxID=237 RepID=UPI001CA72F11|nr:MULTISPECIES: DUF1896 domain-containing protein [Flavobacterium]MBY8963148.1 DUF1896 family protein [Flavobacterium coralii]MCR5863516.1 DUF1896 domain-containing protein [Flavobacterium sp. J372]